MAKKKVTQVESNPLAEAQKMVSDFVQVKREFELVDKPLFITSSLVDAVDFHVGLPLHSPWKLKSLISLQGQLSRAKWDGDTQFTKRGQDFEDKVCAMSRVGTLEAFLNAFKPDCMCEVEKLTPFYTMIKNGKFQKEMKGVFNIDGQSFTFYGKADVVQPGHHIDIKTTSSVWKEDGKYSSPSKYTSRAQHQMYMVLDNVNHFTYLIAEFLDLKASEGKDAHGEPIPGHVPDWRIIDVHQVEILESDMAELTRNLHNHIMRSVNFISQDPTMWANYCEVFTRPVWGSK